MNNDLVSLATVPLRRFPFTYSTSSTFNLQYRQRWPDLKRLYF